jgi:Na+-transporting NADH:ubiquinone oxidoreductase subunit C
VASDKDSMKNILVVALSVCFVCSVVVSAAAVFLKPTQLANKELDRNKNILIAAGLFEKDVTPESDIDKLFESFEVRVVDMQQQRFMSEAEVSAAGIDPAKFDQRKAAKDSALSVELSDQEDIASISRRANYSIAYLLKTEGKLDRIVLPIHGYGLWSTLYGFIALEGDGNTVSGITFYEHKETPGLGGEVDNPRWKSLWPGKQVYGNNGEVALSVLKGKVVPGNPSEIHQVDGISGASLTTRGVHNLIAYWLGDKAFGPVIKDLKG